ncbi:MAG: hypothetical protein K8W52_09205 [Deltaproteobacteria bacterium]|nr:hypothetical protein [Deltaproteobacteria bacterium]
MSRSLFAVLCVSSLWGCGSPAEPVDVPIDAPIVAEPGPRVLPTCGGTGACDLIAQTCPDDQACVFDSGGAASCVPRGTAPEGGRCEGNDQCQPGLVCDLPNATDGGVCRRLCCPGATGGCAIEASCVALDGSDVGLCLPDAHCRPPAEGCGDGESCYVVSARGQVACLPSGALPEGATCAHVADCAAGLACLGTDGGAAHCVRMCDPDTSAGCGDHGKCGLLPSGRAAVCEPQ